MKAFSKDRKKRIRKTKPAKIFVLKISGVIEVTADDIWDGDAPSDPTVEDVLDYIEDESFSPFGFLNDYLDSHCCDSIDLDITEKPDKLSKIVKKIGSKD